MASLAQHLFDLASRVGAEVKAVRASLANYVTSATYTTGMTGKANVNAPAFTGVPTAPTPATATNTTQVATTAFVKAQLASTPLTGVPTAPTAAVATNTTQIATTAFVKLQLASTALTGTPTAPTAAAGVSTTQIATTAFTMTGLNLKANLSGAAFTGAISAPNHLTTMSAFCSGKPAVSEVVGGQIFPVVTTITQGNCVAKATVAATASTVFTIAKDGTTVGTITFAAGATLATISITSGAITALQHVTITAPATADATLANISFLVRA